MKTFKHKTQEEVDVEAYATRYEAYYPRSYQGATVTYTATGNNWYYAGTTGTAGTVMYYSTCNIR